MPTPEVVGEHSFGHNPISDKLYGMLMQLDRKRFPEITIEMNKKENRENFNFLDSIRRHKKALIAATAALTIGSCIVYPSLVKGKLTFDLQLTLNHFSQAIRNLNPVLFRVIFHLRCVIITQHRRG